MMGFFGYSLKKARRLSRAHDIPLNFTRRAFSSHAEFHVDKKVISYNPARLFSYGFINPKGSTLNWGVVFRTLIMCGVGTLASQYTCPKEQTYSFCFPIIVPGEGLIFASLVSFLLGLFISTTFSRWWAVREKLGIIMNNISSLNILLNSFAPHDSESEKTVKKIIRWMHLSHALIYKEANDDYDMSDLKETKLIHDSEATVLSECKGLNHPPIVYGWVMHSVQPLLMKMTPAPAAASIIGCIHGSINAAQEISAYLKTQMPYMYLHLLALTTKIHLALIIFYSGGMISQGITDSLWTRIFLGYTIIITNNIIYEGLLRVHEMLYNPLGDDHADFPTSLYIADTMALGNALDVSPPSTEDETYKEECSVIIPQN